MNITPEQARALLANQSERGALWNADWNFTDRTAAIVREDSPGDEVMEIRFNGDDTAFSDGDLTLAAAAPDLAQTIAGMEWEYGLRQPSPEPDAEGELYTSWGYRLFAAKAAFAGLTDRGVECYIVRRLVGPVEVAE